jgi:hypothetical protein
MADRSSDGSLATSSLALGGVRYTSARGSLECWLPVPRVAIDRWTGHAEPSWMQPFEEHLRRAKAPMRIFHDLARLDGYESEVRTKITSIGIELLRHIERIDVFVVSRLAKMGVSVAALALFGRVRGHDTHEQFCDTLDAVIDLEHGPRRFSRLIGLCQAVTLAS